MVRWGGNELILNIQRDISENIHPELLEISYSITASAIIVDYLEKDHLTCTYPVDPKTVQLLILVPCCTLKTLFNPTSVLGDNECCVTKVGSVASTGLSILLVGSCYGRILYINQRALPLW